jgi:hypothetical protein
MQVLLKVGLPLNSYVGYKRDGYFQNLDEVTNGPKPTGLTVVPGDNRYVDVNKDGIIDENDKFVLGNPFRVILSALTITWATGSLTWAYLCRV